MTTLLLLPEFYLNGRSRAAPSRGLHSPLLLPRAEPGFNLVSMIDVPSCTLGPPPRVRCSQAASLTQEPLSTRACTVIWTDAFHTHVDRFITSKQEAHRDHCSIALISEFTATTVGKVRLAPASTSTASCYSIHKKHRINPNTPGTHRPFTAGSVTRPNFKNNIKKIKRIIYSFFPQKNRFNGKLQSLFLRRKVLTLTVAGKNSFKFTRSLDFVSETFKLPDDFSSASPDHDSLIISSH